MFCDLAYARMFCWPFGICEKAYHCSLYVNGLYRHIAGARNQCTMICDLLIMLSRKIFNYFQWGVETNLAKIQKHNTVQGHNSEENPFKIILFLCCRRILVRSATFDSHPAARGRSWMMDPTGQLELGPGGPKGAWRAPQEM